MSTILYNLLHMFTYLYAFAMQKTSLSKISVIRYEHCSDQKYAIKISNLFTRRYHRIRMLLSTGVKYVISYLTILRDSH